MEKNSNELISRLSYEIVREIAPDELDLFDDIKEEFLKNPDAFLEKDPGKKEEMLGVNFSNFIDDSYLPRALMIFEKLNSGENVQSELTCINNKGCQLNIRVYLNRH